MSSLPKNKKSYININNSLKKLPLERYSKNDISKENKNKKQRSLLLKSINSKSKDRIISKKLNNSANNIKSNNSFNKIEKVIHKDSFNIKNKFYKNNHYNDKFRCLKNNNIHPNANNSVREKKIDIFNSKIKLNNSKNKDLNFSQNMNVNTLSPFLIKNKSDRSKEKYKFKKIENNADSYRSKTPIIVKNIDNNPKSLNRNYNSSKNRKGINNNKHRSNLLYGANININNLIKKENNALRNVIQQEKLHLKQTLLNPLIFKEKNKNENINQNENTNNYFVEIHPKIIQQKETEKLKTDKSGNEILPLTTNSTNINMQLNNTSTINNLKSSNSDMINSAVIKPQFNNSNNNSKIYISNDSNTHLNLNIYSSRSLNNNKNFLKDNNNSNNTNSLLNETFNINKITSEFKGKKIKCIHDISKTGLSGDEKKVNQDRDFIFHNFVSGFENIFMGVCDGHGFFGHEISEFIKENLPMDLNRIIKSKKLDLNKDDLSKVLIETFKMENESLKRYKQIDSDLSGSTCVSVIYTPKKLIIANLGDSRCVLGTKNKNEWKYINLSRDHKPDIKEEADRIKKKGGRIRPMIDEDGNFVGPMRVYMKDKDMPGLAMTRSFGDNFASIAGTICEPEIKEHILVPEDKFIVLASDGLFEFISSEEVGNIVKGYYEKNDIVGCCEYLYKESYRKWLCEEEDTVDDITIILVFFEDN